MTPTDDPDAQYLDRARTVSELSPDPSTRVGAILVRGSMGVVGTGTNRFPRGTRQDPELYADRPRKYLRVLHAEACAVVDAAALSAGSTLYVWPFTPCSQCAALLIEAGVRRVVACDDPPPERWRESFEEGLRMLEEAGVEVKRLPAGTTEDAG